MSNTHKRKPRRIIFMAKDCPAKINHTHTPDGYSEFFVWVKAKAQTHRQVQCKTCGLYAIWEPKQKQGVNDEVLRTN